MSLVSQDLFSCFHHFIGIKPNQLWVLYLGQVNQLPGDFGQPLRLCLGPGSHRGVVGAAGVGVVVDTPPNPRPDLVRILEDAQRFAERRVEGPDLKGLQNDAVEQREFKTRIFLLKTFEIGRAHV